jgi:hypothetical protein
MQRELPPIDFSTQAEVRLEAEARRTEEVSGLLRSWFGEWLAKFRQFERPVLQTVAHSRQPAASGNRLAGLDHA